MKIKDIPEQLGLATSVTEIEVNPLRVCLDHEFGKPNTGDGDYRERAIKRCVDNLVNFGSEENTICTLSRDLIPTIKCPRCHRNMGLANVSGGVTGSWTNSYQCDRCNVSVSITHPSNGIHVDFHQDKG